MTRLQIDGLSKSFVGKPPTVAMDDLHIEIEEGEFLVLLGPSGCGKTTTLRCIAGLETPDRGRIEFGNEAVFDSNERVNLPPERRKIGMVFQSYALWPHMTVRRNIAYPLKARRMKAISKGWVEEAAALVDCEHLLDRYPSQLSGGQQQRVALARGLVARPDVVLFDEPLSNLDARLRDQVRSQLHELHARLGFTAVFVTHDQTEALALADRLAIMRNGRFEQVGRPQDVYVAPASEYVAEFIGISNRFTVVSDGATSSLGGVALDRHTGLEARAGTYTGRLRPEDLIVDDLDAAIPDGHVTIPGTVLDAQFGGRHYDVVVKVGDARLVGEMPAGDGATASSRPSAGTRVQVHFAMGSAMWFDGDGQRVDDQVVRAVDRPVVTT